jgi:hypothetical protein
MQVINIIDPFDPIVGIQTLSMIEPEHIIERNLTLNLDSYHTLDLTVTPNSQAWDLFQDPLKIYGVAVQTGYINMPFVKIDSQMSSNDGNLDLKLVSMSYFLKYSKSFPNQIFTGNLQALLNNLNPNYIFTLINTDKPLINFPTTREFMDYELLEKATENYQWRDNGMVTSGGVTRPQILFGDIDQISSYYDASPSTRLECKPIIINDLNEVNDDIDYADAEIRKNESGDYFTHLDVYSSVSGIDGINSQININPSNVITEDGFPLEEVIKNGVTYFLVRNLYALPYPRKEGTLKVDSTSNTEDGSGNQLINTSFTPQQIYNSGVSYLKTKRQRFNYSNSIKAIKRVMLPGNELWVNINKKIEIDGVSKTIIQLDRKFIFKAGDSGATFDLNVIQN